MKIKILKDIPGYKAGTIILCDGLIHIDKENSSDTYTVYQLIKEGFAEKVKDEIDMEEIRKQIYRNTCSYCEQSMDKEICSDTAWFTAYRIVKAVIEKLNGDWKPNWNSDEFNKYQIGFSYEKGKFQVDTACRLDSCAFLTLKNNETSYKVIEICEPELKILFGIK